VFIVLLRFADNRSNAPQFMQAHNDWIKRGFDDGVFLMVGSLRPNLGGGILAHNTSLAELQQRVDSDPFVAQKIVNAEVLELAPAKTDQRLSFLGA
jgi:uncharacterized protein YciI